MIFECLSLNQCSGNIVEDRAKRLLELGFLEPIPHGGMPCLVWMQREGALLTPMGGHGGGARKEVGGGNQMRGGRG